ncbi:MAG: hypothetical protein HKN92_00050 [Chitinophagales bacterium]|nr:hypothetical protein [Chitinophagales bacterium]
MKKASYSINRLEEEKLLLRTEIELCAEDFKSSIGATGESLKSNLIGKVGIGTAVAGIATLGFNKWFGGKSKKQTSNSMGSSLLVTLLPIGIQFIQSYLSGDEKNSRAA